MSNRYIPSQGVVYRETSDDKLRDLLSEFNTNTSIQTSPYDIAMDAINSKGMKILNLKSDAYDFYIIAAVKSHVIEETDYVIPCDFYVVENTQEKGWYIPENAEVESDEFPVLKNCPTLTKDVEDGQAERMYCFSDGTELVAEENLLITRKDDSPIEITHLTRIPPTWKNRWAGKTTNGDYVYLSGRTGTCRIHISPDIENIRDGDLYFHANIGRANIGPFIHDDELFSLFDSFRYISFADEPSCLPELSDEEQSSVFHASIYG
jgi:hypothetical protein